MYQLLLKDGSKTGQYNPNSSPSKTAEKIARELYNAEGMTGTQTFKFQFVKNRIKAEGGDKLYSFEARVKEWDTDTRILKISNVGIGTTQSFTSNNLN